MSLICPDEERYVTLTLAALLNQVSEKDLALFLTNEANCNEKDIASALSDAKVLMRQTERWNAYRAVTVPMLRLIVSDFLKERSRRFKEANDNDEFFTSQIQSIAKSLDKGEFIVRITSDYEAQEPESQHDLVPGHVYVIELKRPLNDGTRDAWYCGYNVADTTKARKWLFSDFTQIVYPR